MRSLTIAKTARSAWTNAAADELLDRVHLACREPLVRKDARARILIDEPKRRGVDASSVERPIDGALTSDSSWRRRAWSARTNGRRSPSARGGAARWTRRAARSSTRGSGSPASAPRRRRPSI
jgi:hypothetical protein